MRISGLDFITVTQKKELLEAFTGIEGKNTYQIQLGSNPSKWLAIKVNSSFFKRNFFGGLRSIELSIRDQDDNQVLYLKIPFRFYFSEVHIYDANSTLLGKIKREFKVFGSKYNVESDYIHKNTTIHRPLFKPWTFYVKKQDGLMATILKNWSGMGKEIFTDADNFSIKIDEHLNEKGVFLLLGALFLIEFHQFENRSGIFTNILDGLFDLIDW